jgi:hypothetical protein
MAIFHPSSPADGCHRSEQVVRNALAALDDRWHVFHDIWWQAVRDGREADGQIDFVLLHADHGLVVIEVKGGKLGVAEGRWFTVSRGRRIGVKDPFKQALDSKHPLIRYLKPRLQALPPVCHAVALPDVTVGEVPGLHSRPVVLDAADLADAPAAVARILRHWRQRPAVPLSDSEVAAIINTLAPTMTLKTGLWQAAGEAQVKQIELTHRQMVILEATRFIPKAVVRGRAGTGKTLLAMEKARQLATAGRRVLFLCYNTLLCRRIKGRLDEHRGRITVRTFHGLCTERCLSSHGDEARVPFRPDQNWWRVRAAEALRVVVTSQATGELYDAMVIDEAQDFNSAWLDALMCLLVKDPIVYLFLDELQRTDERDLRAPEGWPVLELDRNCRNAEPIAAVVAKVNGAPPQPRRRAGGTPVAFWPCPPEELVSSAHRIVQRLIEKDGVPPEKILVLTDRLSFLEELSRTQVCGRRFHRSGAFGMIQVETVHAFKGLEAAVVVLVIAAKVRAVKQLRWSLYVGMSRARAVLEVVGLFEHEVEEIGAEAQSPRAAPRPPVQQRSEAGKRRVATGRRDQHRHM